MFTLQSKPNPLVTFGGHLAQGLADKYTQDTELSRRNEEIKKGFAKLGENYSTLDLLQTIEGLRIPDEQKERLYKGFTDAEKEKLARKEEKKKFDKEEKIEREKVEKEEKNQIRAKKLSQTYGISEGEAEGLSPTDIAQLGRFQAKPPPGGPGIQPIPPEVVQKMEEVRAKNPNATGQEFLQKMDKAGVPRRWSEPEAKLQSEQDVIKSQDPYFKAAQQKQAQTNVEFADTIINKGDKAKQNLVGIEGMRKNIGSTGFNFWNKLADITGQEWMRDPESEEFKTYSKQSLFKAPEIVKGKVSNFEFQTISELYANAGKSQKANEGLLDWQEYTEKVDVLEATEANKILKENRGIPPPDFRQQLNEKVDGPAEKLTQEWRKKKNKIVDKVFKTEKVKKGTPIDQETAKNYLMKARNHLPNGTKEEIRKEAERMAKDDNYEF